MRSRFLPKMLGPSSISDMLDFTAKTFCLHINVGNIVANYAIRVGRAEMHNSPVCAGVCPEVIN